MDTICAGDLEDRSVSTFFRSVPDRHPPLAEKLLMFVNHGEKDVGQKERRENSPCCVI